MYNPILTNIGKAKIADAIANNTTVNINTLAVGDSNGTRYSPTESQINLVNERYRTTIDSISIKPESPSLIEMIGVVPSNIGGFTIREVAVFDSDGDMIAISDHPDFEKFIISGSANSLELKFMIAVTNTDVVTLIVDDSAIYATREYVNNLDNGNVKTLNINALLNKPLSRHNKPLFTKVNPHSISIPAGFKVVVNNKIISLSEDYVLSLNSNLDEGTKIAGKDYYVYARENGTFYISANNSITTDKLLGGFHYGLTPENEVRPTNALKTEDDMVMSRGIKGYSLWDLSWKPKNKRPEGKVLVNNIFWRDIYPADEDYALRGYSSCFALDGVTSAKIAGGEQTNGRKFPKIPLTKGGNGTLNYGSLTWYEANEIINEVGSRMISYDEFSNSSYGVVEQKSLKELGYPLGTG